MFGVDPDRGNICYVRACACVTKRVHLYFYTIKHNMPVPVQSYYQAKIESAELLINKKTQNLRRLEAQRNALNARGTYDGPVCTSE